MIRSKSTAKLVLCRLFGFLNVSNNSEGPEFNNHIEMLSAVLQEIDTISAHNIVERLVERKVIARNSESGQYNFTH